MNTLLCPGLEPHKQHLFRRFLLRERPVHKSTIGAITANRFASSGHNAWRGEHADRKRGFQIPPLLPQQAFRGMVHWKSFGMRLSCSPSSLPTSFRNDLFLKHFAKLLVIVSQQCAVRQQLVAPRPPYAAKGQQLFFRKVKIEHRAFALTALLRERCSDMRLVRRLVREKRVSR